MEYQKLAKNEYLKLPKDPGVYKFFDKENTIIYVGKAKSLSKRVSSYFTKSQDVNRKTQKLVREVLHIEFVIVNSEFDALLLENNLIKQNQPKYNILLKDDKSFPSICITNERFPRVYSTRRIDKSKGEYFGPYTSVKAMNNVLDLVSKLCYIRTCNFNLSKRNVENKKFKICLEYHIGNCKGPCEDLQSEEDYLADIEVVKKVLKGQVSIVREELKNQMHSAAQTMQFELAQNCKDKLELLDRFQTKTLIVHPKLDNIDILGVVKTDTQYFVNYSQILEGAIKVSETVDFKISIDSSDSEVLSSVLFSLREKFDSQANEILSNIPFEPWDELSVTVPKIGDKKKLLDLSIKNALYHKNEILSRKKAQEEKSTATLVQLQKDLNLKSLPKHIECFDNSNLQGTNPVASMVCFLNGKPSKKNYRRFNIKTVVGPDDFGSMREIVNRRYKRLKNEGSQLPDLIVIDGGKGQLSSACDALKEIGLYGEMAIVGIAKKLEEIYFPEDSIPIHISKKSISLKLLQHLRDEAHRFAITFHRDKRSSGQLVSELDQIIGIGPKTKSLLLDHFKSVTRIQNASIESLAEVIGQAKSILVFEHFHKKRA